MKGSVLSFLKAEWKVSDTATGSAHWASSYCLTTVDCIQCMCLVILYYLKYCYVKPSLHLAIFWCQMICLFVQILCMSPTSTWISKVICHGLFVLRRFEVRGDCWYWCNCWSSLLNSLVLVWFYGVFCHFQQYTLYCGGQFYLWIKPEDLKKTTDLS